jgi:hypothetical protein
MSDTSNTGTVTDPAAPSGTATPDTPGNESWVQRKEDEAEAEFKRLKTVAERVVKEEVARVASIAKAVEDSKLVEDLLPIIQLAAGHNHALAAWEQSPAGKAHLEVSGGQAVAPSGEPDTEVGGDPDADPNTVGGDSSGPVNTGGTVVSSTTAKGSSSEETGGGTSASPGSNKGK